MTMKQLSSLRISSFSWGKMEVEQLGTGKDFKLWPGGGRAWDWSEFGTNHRRGIQHQELEELIDRGAQVIVLSTGRLNRLKVPKKIVEMLREKEVEVVVADTKEAIAIYNSYVKDGAAVGGLFHSTC